MDQWLLHTGGCVVDIPGVCVHPNSFVLQKFLLCSGRLLLLWNVHVRDYDAEDAV